MILFVVGCFAQNGNSGGLPACQASLDTCNTNLASTTSLLTTCDSDLGVNSAREARTALQVDITRGWHYLIRDRARDIMATQTIPPGFSSPTNLGTIAPLGVFSDTLGILEYYFGLAFSNAARVNVINFHYIHGSNNLVSYQVEIVLQLYNGNVTVSKFMHKGTFAFNADNLICGFDVTFLWMPLLDTAETATAHTNSINNICNGIQAVCIGANQKYDNVSDCSAYLHSIPYGGWGKADQNTVGCRNIHLALARVDPNTHCPHVARAGPLNLKCYNKPYLGYFNNQYLACVDPNY